MSHHLVQQVLLFIESKNETAALAVLSQEAEDDETLFNFQLGDTNKSKLMEISLFYKLTGPIYTQTNPEDLLRHSCRQTEHLASTLRESLQVDTIYIATAVQMPINSNKAPIVMSASVLGTGR